MFFRKSRPANPGPVEFLVAGLGNKEMREGTFDYYMREPIVKNEAKGVAPLILAYIEILFREKGE